MAIWKQNTPSTIGFIENAPASSGTGTPSGGQGNWGDTSYNWSGSNVTDLSAFTWANVITVFGAVWQIGATIGKSVFKSN